ncbi:MAG TPA: TolC family protein [Terriglobales bacterium]|nr:TolC family protein [Terriglobales bacterium]
MVCIYLAAIGINIQLLAGDVPRTTLMEPSKTSKPVWEKYLRLGALGCFLSVFTMFCNLAAAQTSGASGQGGSSSNYGSLPESPANQTSPGTGLSFPAQTPFAGSVPEGKATNEVLQLSFKDALDRALRNNLGLLLQSDNRLATRGAKWRELSELLPHLSASATQSVEQIDLAALGFRFNFPGVPKVVGPIGVFQSGIFLNQSLFDFNAIERTRGAREDEKAAEQSVKNARELVVLAVGNVYLLCLSSAARVETAQAEVQTAQALYDKASDQQKAGVSPNIDVLRARVELQTRQTQYIIAKNDDAKEKLQLGRVIGLPAGQEFTLTTEAPYQPLATSSLEDNLRRAYLSRPDYLAAVLQVRAAEARRRAATAQHYPTLGIGGDYGDAGVNIGQSHGVFQIGATLNIPITAGGRTHADVLEAEASLRQSRQQLDNLRGQIDYQVRAALLDLSAASDQVEVARSSVDLANQTLVQARDRFAAGVTDNLEVVEAQEAVAAANETYISSLYAHNLAKVELATAIGFAEEGVKQYLQGK